MKDYDYHSLFYYGILTPLQNIVGNYGEPLSSPNPQKGAPEFCIAYPARERGYAHQYQRDAFLLDRERLIIGRRGAEPFVVLLSIARHEDRVVVYKKALRSLFRSDTAIARRELTRLLEKFYEVTVSDVSSVSRVERGSNPGGENQTEVNSFVRLPRNGFEEQDARVLIQTTHRPPQVQRITYRAAFPYGTGMVEPAIGPLPISWIDNQVAPPSDGF